MTKHNKTKKRINRKGGYLEQDYQYNALNLSDKLSNIANNITYKAREALDDTNTALGNAYNTIKYKTETGATSLWNELFNPSFHQTNTFTNPIPNYTTTNTSSNYVAGGKKHLKKQTKCSTKKQLKTHIKKHMKTHMKKHKTHSNNHTRKQSIKK